MRAAGPARGPRGLRLTRGVWEGNRWPSVELDREGGGHEGADFLPVMTQLCAALAVPLPPIIDTLDGHLADLVVDGADVKVLLDNWSFSIAAESEALRERIFDALRAPQ